MTRRKRKNNTLPAPLLLFFGGGIALIIAAVLLFNQNNNTSPSAEIAEGIPYPEIARVSLVEAKTALDAGTAIFVDVRSADAFAGQRITGAVNIPTAEVQDRLTELDLNDWIIPYCT